MDEYQLLLYCTGLVIYFVKAKVLPTDNETIHLHTWLYHCHYTGPSWAINVMVFKASFNGF